MKKAYLPCLVESGFLFFKKKLCFERKKYSLEITERDNRDDREKRDNRERNNNKVDTRVSLLSL